MEEINPINVTLSLGDLIRNMGEDLLWIAATELIVRLDKNGAEALMDEVLLHLERLEKPSPKASRDKD